MERKRSDSEKRSLRRAKSEKRPEFEEQTKPHLRASSACKEEDERQLTYGKCFQQITRAEWRRHQRQNSYTVRRALLFQFFVVGRRTREPRYMELVRKNCDQLDSDRHFDSYCPSLHDGTAFPSSPVLSLTLSYFSVNFIFSLWSTLTIRTQKPISSTW